MNDPRRRVLLFLLCAVVLLGAGYASGYSRAYDAFYSPDASLDRELVHLDFNTRVLYYVNQQDGVECRRELLAQLRQQMTYVAGLLNASSPVTREFGSRKLRAAERVVAGQSIKEEGVLAEAGGE